MSGNKKVLVLGYVAVAAVAIVAGYNMALRDSPFGIGPKCPDKLKKYCDSWTVDSSQITEADKHMKVSDKFSIAATSKGAEPPIWLTAKSQLETRWKGEKNVKLREIEDSGAVQCMVGRVNLNHADGVDHDWHQLTVTTDDKPTGEVDEDGNLIMVPVLKICVSKRDNGTWPNQCEILSCVDVGSGATGEAPQSHGGRAHAQN